MGLTGVRALDDADLTSGEGGHGLDFRPSDQDLSNARDKAQAVLSGTASFTFSELQRIVARLLMEV